MRVEALAVALRPRLASEASDLGVALVRTHARSVWRSFAPVYAVFFLLACATVEIRPWLPSVLIWWCKPWLDCCLLFILSRAVFGQSTRFADLWRPGAAIWRRQWLRTLLWQRLSFWRSFTQPVYQLEGQRGPPMRRRRRLLLDGQRGPASAMMLAFLHVEMALYFGLVTAMYWLIPQGSQDGMFEWLLSGSGAEQNYWALTPAVIYAAVVLVVEPFYVAAGLALYLNRRVELEAWDIEQEFRHDFAS